MEVADPARARRLAQGLLLAIDPGLRYPAAALFWQGRLQIAERVKVPGALHKQGLGIGHRCRAVSRLILEWYASKVTNGTVPIAIVAEYPQIYARGAKGDGNDLLPLAAIVNGVATHFPSSEFITPLPREWIGSIKKSETGDPWLSPRGMLVARRLDVVERAAVVSSHDAIDAAGLGLWIHCRLL